MHENPRWSREIVHKSMRTPDPAATRSAVAAIADAAGLAVRLHRDLAGRDRVLELKIPLGKAGGSA